MFVLLSLILLSAFQKEKNIRLEKQHLTIVQIIKIIVLLMVHLMNLLTIYLLKPQII